MLGRCAIPLQQSPGLVPIVEGVVVVFVAVAES